jgi:hypothetical protein
MNPAVMIGAALVAVGAIAAFAIKRSPQPEHVAVASEVGYLTACACASCWCAPPSDAADTDDQDESSGRIPTLAGVA